MAHLQEALRNETVSPPPWPPDLTTDDEINAWIYAANRDRPLADVLVESRDVLQQLMNALDAIPDADLLHPDPARFPWLADVQLPLAGALFFAHFYEEHEPDMRAWLERIRREKPYGAGVAAVRVAAGPGAA